MMSVSNSHPSGVSENSGESSKIQDPSTVQILQLSQTKTGQSTRHKTQTEQCCLCCTVPGGVQGTVHRGNLTAPPEMIGSNRDVPPHQDRPPQSAYT